MKHSANQEMELITDLLAYQYDPYGFVMYAYPWGEVGTPLEHIPGPRKWQEAILKDIGEHTRNQKFQLDNEFFDSLDVYQEVDASGRGIGKSALFGMLSQWQVSCHLGSSVLVTANTESQLRSKTFPEFAKWFHMSINSHWFEVEGMKIGIKKWLADLCEAQLKISALYWNVQGQNWSEENPDAFAGSHNSYGLAVFYDEASGIPEPIWGVTEGFFTELNPFRYWMAFSNPRRNSGAFFDRFHKPEMQEFWRSRQIDARTVEGSDQSVYNKIIKQHGADSDTARVEVYGQFPEQGENQFISNSTVRSAQERPLTAFDDSQPLIMGVDPAPRGRTVIRFRQGRDARSIPPTELIGKDNTAISDTIVDLINKYDPDAIAIDAGNGTGVIDNLKARGVRRVYEVWFGTTSVELNGEFATLGSELWGRLRDWLPGGHIDDSVALFNDLTKRTWKWFGREDGKKLLTPKRDMAKDGIPSPDDADALALTFYPKVPRRNKRTAGYGAGATPVAKDMDYDVLNH